jgi:predicted nucleic-acid-binding protein
VRAIDTNVIVRFLTGDDPAQTAKARKLVEAGGIFVPTSVLLETEWVLRSGYGFAAERLVRALRDFAGLPGVTLEDPRLAATALDWAEQGLDFADALYLGAAQGCTAFMSFDRRLAKAAAGMSDVRVLLP